MQTLRTKRGGLARFPALVGIAVVGCVLASAQVVVDRSTSDGVIRLYQTDWATLELQEPRQDLPCTVTPSKPVLGFDLRLHTGYEVAIQLENLAGHGDTLTAIFRVTPQGGKFEPTFFTQRLKVPPLGEDVRGEAYLNGEFDIGEGKYHVDWLMRDGAERVCSSYWDIESELSERDREVPLVLPPGRVEASDPVLFAEEPPVERLQGEQPLNVKVLVNFAPQKAGAAILQPLDTQALVSILRNITREPRIGKFSIVAFNLQEQRVIFRQDEASRIDFPALGEALNALDLGTVDIRRLSQKHGETQFLADLIRREAGGENQPDALVFAGPKAFLEQNVPAEQLEKVGTVGYPVFYMNYTLNPQSSPWRDAIGNIVRFFRGTEYTITRPRDLWVAVGEMITRVVKWKSERLRSAAAGR
jgi:hypothetical protein